MILYGVYTVGAWLGACLAGKRADREHVERVLGALVSLDPRCAARVVILAGMAVRGRFMAWFIIPGTLDLVANQ